MTQKFSTSILSVPPSSRNDRPRLGDILLAQKLITQAQLIQAMEIQKKTNARLGQIFVEMNIITEEALAAGLARQMGIPLLNLNRCNISAQFAQLLPEAVARKFKAIIVEDKNTHVDLAISDPFNIYAKDEIENIIKKKIVICIATETSILSTIDRIYRKTVEISGLTKALESDLGKSSIDLKEMTSSADNESAPVIRLILSIFEDALQAGASDIHIEPMETQLQVRLRINGVLQKQIDTDKRIAPAVTQRLKLMSGLDISEKRLPQDGRFSVKLRNSSVDVRISTLPSQHGESTVMRLLRPENAERRLESIGMPPKMFERYRTILNRSSGMILVTGPTGSGKTTTLYASLADLDAEHLKLITVEDPIEYRLPGITQVQVNDKIEFTFSKVLRSCLRQDPDVILVGEMRDTETAEIGLRAAATGHLVLSTLHTNSAVATPMRLLDMGVPPFMVATSLHAVIAQRLIGTLCPSCKGVHQPTAQEMAWLTRMATNHQSGTTWYGSPGCSACSHTGFGSRLAVYEMFELNEELAQMIAHGKISEFNKEAAIFMRGKSYVFHALELAKQGLTSLSEVMRLSVDSE